MPCPGFNQSQLCLTTQHMRRPEAEDEGLAAEVLMSRFGMLDGGCAALPRPGAPRLVRTERLLAGNVTQ